MFVGLERWLSVQEYLLSNHKHLRSDPNTYMKSWLWSQMPVMLVWRKAEAGSYMAIDSH